MENAEPTQGNSHQPPLLSWKIYVVLFALLLLCYSYVHQKDFDGPTPVSRLNLLHSLFEHGVLHIDHYHENTPDKAEFQGHYYSDKAPGTVVLALPAFASATAGLSLFGVDLDSETGWLVSSWVACVGSIGIITALGGVALFAWLAKYVPARIALITTLALFLGAAPLPYATMMFSHAMVVGLLSIAIWAVDKGKPREAGSTAKPSTHDQNSDLLAKEGQQTNQIARRTWPDKLMQYFLFNRGDFLAGFACGWVLASEYSAGLMVIGLLFWLLSMDWRRVIPFALAAIPPLLLIPAYSWACFGEPFTLAYSHQASFPQMQEGLYAIKWPDALTGFNLLFSPERGLLFWTPFLLIAIFGYWKLIQKSIPLFWLTYSLPLIQIVVISGRTWDWQAGPTFGPRLLAPLLPWLALPCAYGLRNFPKLGITLAAYSILITTLATLTDACPAYNLQNPLLNLHLPLLFNADFSPNLGLPLYLPPYFSFFLYWGLIIAAFVYLRSLPARTFPKPPTRT